MVNTIQINNNIYLHYIPMEKLKTTALGLYIHRNLNVNDATKNALLPYVLKRGCRLCENSEEIAHYLENLYGASMGAAVMKQGEDQVIMFDMESISDKYAPEGELLIADLTALLLSSVFEPLTINGAFKQEYFDQEKKNMEERIKSLINDKRTYASIRCTEEMCSGDAFSVSRLGTIEDLQKIDAKQLYEYYSEIITSSVIDIYVCGDTDIQAVKQKIEEFTKKLTFRDAVVPHTQILVKDGHDVKTVEDKMEVTQGKLSIGFRTNIKPSDKEYWGLIVANSIFGSGAHSKLFNHVREKLSLAYYASSQLEKFKGLMIVNAGVEFSNFQAAYDETLLQLEAIQKGEITELEFTSSVQAILNALESYYDDQRYIQSFYLGEKISGCNHDIEFVKEQVKQVTIEDVKKAAKMIELDTVYFLNGKGGELNEAE